MSKLQTYAVRFATALVALVAMLLSYHALAIRAAEAAIPSALAWVYPLAVDGLLVVGMVASYVLRSAPYERRAYAWFVTGVGLLVSEVGNALAGPLVWDLVLMRSLPPIALALSLHLLTILSRPERKARAARRAPEPIEPARPVIVKPLPPSGSESRSAIARRVLELDPNASNEELRSEGAKLSDSALRRLRSEVRNSERPREAVSG